MEIIVVILSVVVAALAFLVFYIMRSCSASIAELNRQNASLTSERIVHAEKVAMLESNYETRVNELKCAYEARLAEVQKNHQETYNRLNDGFVKQLEQIKANNEQQLNSLRDFNSRQVESQTKLIREQMRTTSEEVLKQRREELNEQNIEQVSKIINPLLDSLRGMRQAFDQNKESQLEAMTRLDETIKQNTRRNAELGATADRLANALTGNVKVQGNFGELKLKQLLENMELHEGEQYDTQETLRDRLGNRHTGSDGRALIPDFILHFPDNRHVVIDAKMSLTAYQRYMDAEEGSPQREQELQNHIASVRSNVNLLSKKEYHRYLPEGYNRLDFAFMYVPIDAALNLALLNDNTLWKDAYDKGVIILGPQTMYMNLRVLEMMWRQVRQLENQQTMINCANKIIERVQDFANRFMAVDKAMRNAVESIDKFKITTAAGGHSIITAARNLVKVGGAENRSKISLDAATTVFLEAPQVENEDSSQTP